MVTEERGRLREQLAIVAEQRKIHALTDGAHGCRCAMCHGSAASLVDAVPQLLAELERLQDEAESREAADIEACEREECA